MNSRDETDNQRRALEQFDRELADLICRRCEVALALDSSWRGNEPGGKTLLDIARSAISGSGLGAQRTSANVAVSADDVAEVLTHISSICQRSDHQQRIAFLGPEYSYSHLASLKYFGDAANFSPVQSIAAVFEAVADGDAWTGLVPIENSTDGRVVDTLGMFIRRRMRICGEVLLPIHHNLLSASQRSEIVEIHSKPQALSQCRRFLADHFPNARLVEVSSTTTAAVHAGQQQGVAAVASLPAGRKYGLDVLAANIEDNKNNVTRFAVLGTEQPQPTGNDKTSLLFQVEHRPGALADVMATFHGAQLNLTWIESFPSPSTRAEYLFFVEFTGHIAESGVAGAIAELDDHTTRLEVLGSYPIAALESEAIQSD